MQYRLNRAISATGFCSRRKADQYIAAGRVSVNGTVVTDFNLEVDPAADELQVDGRNISVKSFEYIVLYKPEGIVTTCNDEFGRRSVIDLLPERLRHLRPIGRLDLDSEGLLLLTNDGEMAQRLTHPSHKVFKRYEVTVTGCLSDDAVKQLTAGVPMDDDVTLPARVRVIKRGAQSSRFEISIREGRNRQIRRMCSKLGYPVERLVRVAIGALQLRQLEPGEWRHLTPEEVRALRSK